MPQLRTLEMHNGLKAYRHKGKKGSKSNKHKNIRKDQELSLASPEALVEETYIITSNIGSAYIFKVAVNYKFAFKIFGKLFVHLYFGSIALHNPITKSSQHRIITKSSQNHNKVITK